MTAYFKAVRLDGTDFHSGTVNWLGGVGVHPHPEWFGAGGYYSVSTVATDCTGMEWPCRLLSVTPRSDAVSTPDPLNLRNKRVCPAGWHVVRELPATDALGPQGVAVAALIRRTRGLTDAEVRRLVAAVRVAAAAGFADVWDVTRDVARGADRDAAVVAAWSAAWSATGLDPAVHVAGGAATALVVRDLIPAGDYRIITAAWVHALNETPHPDDNIADWDTP